MRGWLLFVNTPRVSEESSGISRPAKRLVPLKELIFASGVSAFEGWNDGNSSGPLRKPEGLQEFSPGMSEARAIPWVSGPPARGSKASVSSEPPSRQQRLGAVLLASRVCQRRTWVCTVVLRTGTQGIARQASLIPGLCYGSLSGYSGSE